MKVPHSLPSCRMSPVRASFMREKIENHGSPTGPTAEAPSEKNRSGDLRNYIMNYGACEGACQQIEEETFQLHVLLLDKTEKTQHVNTHKQLSKSPPKRLLFPRKQNIQAKPKTNRRSDVPKVKQIE